jgi:hypothetical protein
MLRQFLLLLFVGLLATLQNVQAAGDQPVTTSPTPTATKAAPTTSKAIVPAGDPSPAKAAKAATPTPSATPGAQARMGAIIISDTENHRVLSIDDMTGKGLKSIGFPGHGVGHLLNPAQVWVDYKGRIYIADKGNHRVIRIDDISGQGWSEMNGFESPEGLAVRGKEVIVSDTGANKVLVYSEFGGNLTQTYSDPRMQRPGHLWLDDKGSLYVTCGSDPPGGRVIQIPQKGDASRWVVFEGQGLKGVRLPLVGRQQRQPTGPQRRSQGRYHQRAGRFWPKARSLPEPSGAGCRSKR